MIIQLTLASIIWTTTHSASCSDITRCSDLGLTEIAYDATGGSAILDALNGDVRWASSYVGCCKSPCTALYNNNLYDELSSFTIHQSTAGFKDITVIYDMNPNFLDASDACNAEYSSDGGSSYDTIEIYLGLNTDRKGEVKVLPDDASNNSGFQLRFDQTITSYEDYYGDYCNIEFVSICGTPITETCVEKGLELSLKHHCECRSASECSAADSYCNSMKKVAGVLNAGFSEDEISGFCDDGSVCCCSCNNCPDYLPFEEE